MTDATVAELVAALRTLGVEGPACAADVFDQLDRTWPREVRDQVLRELSDIELAELDHD